MTNASKIYDLVMDAMQIAEEVYGGLEAEEYIKLMEQIGEECYNRANVCKSIEEKQ